MMTPWEAIGLAPRYLKIVQRDGEEEEIERLEPLRRAPMEIGMYAALVILLLFMLLGAFPTWPHSQNWGYGPSGGLGLVVVILLVLILSGRL